ncbi:MAG: CBS domain-containing protein [Syntrophobacteraceae bacterium]|jgi:CBS domain-containing protein|nr:CBS domain-containing protein [Syntrophobacteraceae bacterium]
MQATSVKELMVPLADYATVSDDATLGDAVAALEEARRRVEADREKHRAVLVLDRNGRVVGKLDQWTVLWALEPRYKQMGNLRDTSRYGFSPDFLKSMIDYYGLWRKPLEGLCRKAAELKVRDIMLQPTAGEQVDADDTLDAAIHQLVMGRHQSLLVTRGEEVVGILRLSDVFRKICSAIEACLI